MLVAAVGRSDAQHVGHPSDPPPPTPPRIVQVGPTRYRVGRIKVDKRRGRLFARGFVLRDEPPLEYVAVTRKGHKGYESLLELYAGAHEFHLASILVGVDPEVAERVRKDDARRIAGDPVDLRVAWRDGAAVRTVPAGDLVELEGATLGNGEWVYIGSIHMPDGRFMAHHSGAAVGFVHYPSSIIEHRTGLLGRFGDVRPNTRLLPPVGTRVTLILARGSR
jgi:hypothetical protein